MGLANLLNTGYSPAGRMTAADRICWVALMRWINTMRWEYREEREAADGLDVELVDVGGEA